MKNILKINQPVLDEVILILDFPEIVNLFYKILGITDGYYSEIINNRFFWGNSFCNYRDFITIYESFNKNDDTFLNKYDNCTFLNN